MPTLWKEIPGFNGRYEISLGGQVKDLKPGRSGPGDPIKVDSKGRSYRILRTFVERKGYISVSLADEKGKRTARFINTLLLITFVGPRPHPKSQCRHLNGVASDNRLSNLAWGGQLENTKDSCDLNSHPFTLTEEEARYVLRSYDGKRGSVAKLARELKVSRCAIDGIVKGKTWKFLDRG